MYLLQLINLICSVQCVLSWNSAGRNLLELWLAVSHGTTRVLHGLALVHEVSCNEIVEIQESLFKIVNPISAVFQTVTASALLNSEKMDSKNF